MKYPREGTRRTFRKGHETLGDNHKGYLGCILEQGAGDGQRKLENGEEVGKCGRGLISTGDMATPYGTLTSSR